MSQIESTVVIADDIKLIGKENRVIVCGKLALSALFEIKYKDQHAGYFRIDTRYSDIVKPYHWLEANCGVDLTNRSKFTEEPIVYRSQYIDKPSTQDMILAYHEQILSVIEWSRRNRKLTETATVNTVPI